MITKKTAPRQPERSFLFIDINRMNVTMKLGTHISMECGYGLIYYSRRQASP